MRRIKYACEMFWLAMRKPELFQHDMLRLVESLWKFLEETAKAERPMTSEMGFKPVAKIDFTGKALLTLWCGYAEKDNPIVRLRELAKENEELRSRLMMLNMQLNDERSVATEVQS